jgi:hypothetical protein
MPTLVSFTSSTGETVENAITRIIDGFMPSTEAMLFAGSRQLTAIRERTQAGMDVDGAPFVDYSEKYAKFRSKHGRNVEPVDLLFSGRGLASLQVEVRGPDSFAIASVDPEAAVYMQAQNDGNERLPARHFFDCNSQELAQVSEDLFGFDKAAK